MITSCNPWVKSKGALFFRECTYGRCYNVTCTADIELRKGRAREGEDGEDRERAKETSGLMVEIHSTLGY